MSVTTRVGAAVAAGYVLGRFKKLRLAVVVASALSNSAVRERSLEMLKIGTQSLGGSADVQKLGQQVSGKLVQAGKAAAVAAAAGQIDKLSDRLHEQSTLWGASSSHDDADQDTDEASEDEDEYEDEEPEDEYEDEPEDEADDEAEEEAEEEPEDEADDEAEEEAEEEPVEEPVNEADQQDEDDEEEKPRRRARSSRRRRAGAPTGGA